MQHWLTTSGAWCDKVQFVLFLVVSPLGCPHGGRLALLAAFAACLQPTAPLSLPRRQPRQPCVRPLGN
eukprot:7137552-Pyramimonas_sp.AAC.1